jgi:hypothetical protein
LGGTGTDAKLDSAMHTSPNQLLSNMGNKEIIALLKGNADAIFAKNQAWQQLQQQGGGSDTYGRFSALFNKSYNPQVFQFQYLDPGKRGDIIKAMSPAERQSFLNSYRVAIQQGWVPDPRGTK